MRVYLAHNFAARDWLRGYVIPHLKYHGHNVTSRWLTDDRHLNVDFKAQSAVADLEDIESAGAIIFFAERVGDVPGEGKYVELGYAIRAGKIVIVVGDGRCIFYNICTIRHVAWGKDWWTEVLPYLGGSQETKMQEGA